MSRHFNGSSTYFTIAGGDALSMGDDTDGSGGFSVAGWMRAAGMADAATHRMLAWGQVSPQFQVYLYGSTEPTSAGQIGIRLQSSQSIYYRANDYSGWGDGDWHHFALTGDGATLRMYHDGTVCAATASISTLDAINRADAFYFGRLPSGSNYYQGDLAEWAKWDTALSSDKITALAHGSRPTEIGLRPAWYLSMAAGLDEEIAGLTVSNYGTLPAEHPSRVIFPSTALLSWACRPAITGPYQAPAAAIADWGAIAGRGFNAGTSIGQINEQ